MRWCKSCEHGKLWGPSSASIIANTRLIMPRVSNRFLGVTVLMCGQTLCELWLIVSSQLWKPADAGRINGKVGRGSEARLLKVAQDCQYRTRRRPTTFLLKTVFAQKWLCEHNSWWWLLLCMYIWVWFVVWRNVIHESMSSITRHRIRPDRCRESLIGW